MRIILLRRKITKLLRFLLLTSIVILGFLFYHLLSFKKDNQILNTNPNIENAEASYEITARNTIFEGVTKDLNPYTINAKKAVKVASDLYQLEQITAYYYAGNKNFAISSRSGTLNNTQHKIDLEGKVQGNSQGFTISSEKAQINLLTDEVFGNDKVKLDYSNSQIKADKFYLKKENLIILEGGVRTKLYIPGL